jgi:hypothetical protein
MNTRGRTKIATKTRAKKTAITAKKTAKADAGERGTTSVTVRLDNELVAWLDARAEQENRSRANLIETLLKRAKEVVPTGAQPTV